MSGLLAPGAVAEPGDPVGTRSTRTSIRSPGYSKPIEVALGVFGATGFPPSTAMTVIRACESEIEKPAEALHIQVSRALLGEACR